MFYFFLFKENNFFFYLEKKVNWGKIQKKKKSGEYKLSFSIKTNKPKTKL